jgi:hypothetical protein
MASAMRLETPVISCYNIIKVTTEVPFVITRRRRPRRQVLTCLRSLPLRLPASNQSLRDLDYNIITMPPPQTTVPPPLPITRL